MVYNIDIQTGGFMKNRFGFSLAEMMVVLLVVAIALAATAPMITRKVSRERSDKIFDILNVDIKCCRLRQG